VSFEPQTYQIATIIIYLLFVGSFMGVCTFMCNIHVKFKKYTVKYMIFFPMLFTF